MNIKNGKFVPAIFYQSFIFSPNDSPSKTMKMFFISSKKLFSFSRYANFCNFYKGTLLLSLILCGLNRDGIMQLSKIYSDSAIESD